MPQVSRVQVILNPAADTREQIMNTWHCVTVGATTTLAAASAFTDDLNDFYQDVAALLSSELNAAVPFLRAFDLSDPKPRQPIVEANLVPVSAGTNRLPREICSCLSYKGTYISGVSPKRKRGRIYIGPLASNSVGASDGKFTLTFRTTLANAGDSLLGKSDLSTEYRWVVYSPASDPLGTGNDPDCWDAVTSGWVDEDPDIQRRRTIPGGTRSLFT